MAWDWDELDLARGWRLAPSAAARAEVPLGGRAAWRWGWEKGC